MSWTIHIEAENEIAQAALDEAIDFMPDCFLGDYRCLPVQDWGWSLAIPVPNPVGNKIVLNGSFGTSGSIARQFSDALVLAMNAAGIAAKVSFNDMDH